MTEIIEQSLSSHTGSLFTVGPSFLFSLRLVFPADNVIQIKTENAVYDSKSLFSFMVHLNLTKF